jgi:membrane protein insertase Oxa1/YidC/SpoIIIJ
MVDHPKGDAPLPRAVTLARIWLLALGCAWFLAGFYVGTTPDGSRWWGIILVAVGILHFAVARYARTRLAVFFSSFGP